MPARKLETVSSIPTAGVRYERVLQPVDLEEPTAIALEHAKHLAVGSGGVLYLLHVVPTDEPHLLRPVYRPVEGGGADVEWARKVAHRRLEEIAERHLGSDLRHRLLVTTGDPAAEILRVAETLPADLIVLSTHGRSGVSHLLLGSVAEKVVRRATCPVLSLRRPAS